MDLGEAQEANRLPTGEAGTSGQKYEGWSITYIDVLMDGYDAPRIGGFDELHHDSNDKT
jgi:hypothetical protein